MRATPRSASPNPLLALVIPPLVIPRLVILSRVLVILSEAKDLHGRGMPGSIEATGVPGNILPISNQVGGQRGDPSLRSG